MSARYGRRGQPEQQSERRVISEDDLEKMKERLCRPRREPTAHDDHLLAKKITISQDALSTQINRLYDQAIETKKRKMEKARRAEEKDMPPTRKLNEEEINESVQRQYTQALVSRHNNEEKLKRKFLFHPDENDAAHQHKMTPRTKREIAAMGARLHDDSRSKKAENMEKLYQKYVYTTGPQKTYISEAEAKEAADRLCAPREGGAPATPRRRDK